MNLRVRAALLAAFAVCSTLELVADEAASTAKDAQVSALPEPYGPDEFPSWLPKLRRLEIISLGAFPILLFYTRFAFDTARFIDSGFDDDGFDATLAPWPFKTEDSYEPTDDEQWTSVGVAAGLSLVFGLVDMLVSGKSAR